MDLLVSPGCRGGVERGPLVQSNAHCDLPCYWQLTVWAAIGWRSYNGQGSLSSSLPNFVARVNILIFRCCVVMRQR